MNRLHSETKEHLNSLFVKDDIYDFIREQYSLINVPTFIFTKLEAVYSGKYKGMGVGIPPEHLLDMWKRKINELNKIADKNLTKGKELSSSARLSYDLSILINKYDSYVSWLNKQKILAANTAAEIKKSAGTEKINFLKVETQSKSDSKVSEKEEMDRFLEELF